MGEPGVLSVGAGDPSKCTNAKVFQRLDHQQSRIGVYQLTVRWGKSHQLGIEKAIVFEHQSLLRTSDPDSLTQGSPCIPPQPGGS